MTDPIQTIAEMRKQFHSCISGLAPAGYSDGYLEALEKLEEALTPPPPPKESKIFQFYEIRCCVEFEDEVVSYMGEPELDETYSKEGALQEATEVYHRDGGIDLYWTLYGRDQYGMATAISNSKTFEGVYEIMQAILLPMKHAYDFIDDHDEHLAADLLIDICNQSTNEDRL
jgi:hypothetical protein